MSRACPIPSAKTVAQKPAGNFNSLVALGHPLPAVLEPAPDALELWLDATFELLFNASCAFVSDTTPNATSAASTVTKLLGEAIIDNNLSNNAVLRSVVSMDELSGDVVFGGMLLLDVNKCVNLLKITLLNVMDDQSGFQETNKIYRRRPHLREPACIQPYPVSC